MRSGSFAPVAAALFTLGCSMGITLTDRGTEVQHVESMELPGGCDVMGDVPIGIPPDAAQPRTEEQLVILMRNKAGQMGATHVLVESSERRGTGSEQHYVGRGRAYACPESRSEIREEPAIEEEETAGDEEGDDAEEDSADDLDLGDD